jgi:formate-dependent phosphoribosylglycinamide formyltransferase (GAR transformylase)
VLLSSLSFSQNSQKNTDPDSYYIQALYKHIVKANQAYIEVKYSRIQIDSCNSIITRKDAVINSLLVANKLATDRNKDYNETFVAQQVKVRACEDLQSKYEFANKRLKIRQDFMQIGTPVIVVSVGIIAGVGGYYLAKIL